MTRRSALFGLSFYVGLGAAASIIAWAAVGLTSQPLSVPLFYLSDALAGGSQVKGVLENGWYEANPMLAAPTGQSMHAFPMADNLQFALARCLGMFSNDWATVYNLLYVATFPMAAIAGAWFFRVVSVGRTMSFVLGLLYAFMPFHFMHGIAHLSLSQYFVAPLGASLAYCVFMKLPIWRRRATGSDWNPTTWLTLRSLGTVGILALLGATSSYYAVFTLIFLAVAACVALARRSFDGVIASVACILGTCAFLLINMLPDIVYNRSHANALPFARQALEAELYAFKLSALVMPPHWSRIDALSTWRWEYDNTFPLAGERAALGVVAAVGFLFLLLLPVVTMILPHLGRRSPVESTASPGLSANHRVLALFSFVAFLFGTVGGFETLFALLVSPSIRAWNRIIVFLGLFAYASIGLLVDAALRRALKKNRLQSGGRKAKFAVQGVAAIVLLAVGLVDQVPPPRWSQTNDVSAEWTRDAKYVAAIEGSLPPDAMIVQLPYLAFPESQPIFDMLDYDPMRMYLHSQHLRWTYGGVRGDPAVEWTQVLGERPVGDLIVQAAAAGAAGLHIDRFAYAGHDASALEGPLVDEVGKAAETSDDGRFAFYDLRPYAAKLESRYGADWPTIGRRTLKAPIVYWQSDFNPPVVDGEHTTLPGKSASPSLTLGNSGGAARIRVAFTLRVDGNPGEVEASLRWPDGTSETRTVGVNGLRVTQTLTIPNGFARLQLSAAGSTSVSVVDLEVTDLVLQKALRRTVIRSDGGAGD